MNRFEARRWARSAAVAVVSRAPLGLFAGARRRYDERLRRDPASRPPLLLRLARLRPVPPAVDAFSPPGRPDVRFVSRTAGVTQWTYWLGMEEVARLGAGTRVWEALCAGADEVVEIGANIGFYTVPGGRAARGAYRAYEPHPESAAVLRANLAENGLTAVDVQEAAVVAGPAREVELAVPPAFDGATPGNATLAPEFSGGSVVPVQGVPVNDVLGAADLLKLDVEGLEAPLLEAAWDELVRLRPAIMIEVHDVNRPLRALLPALLRATEARAYAMRQASLVAVADEGLGTGALFDRYRTWDYLLVPDARRALVTGVRIAERVTR
ncbi:MAG: FkbM family methyltransferase [Acidimicrobiia bacterium]|nr:FkbM family methyltransferase [Acidimicrobiia bacterium]